MVLQADQCQHMNRGFGVHRGKLTAPAFRRRPGMASTVSSSYSVWLMPDGGDPDHPFNQRLQAEIDDLASQHTDAPRFAPHVTLLGGIEGSEGEVLKKAEELSKQLLPYRIEFDAVQSGSFFFQCVFIKCKESPAVMAAARAAKAIYGKDPESLYMPHLSLLYSGIDATTKKSVAAAVQKELFEVDGERSLSGASFEVDRLVLWKTPTEAGSRVEDWEKIAEIPLLR